MLLQSLNNVNMSCDIAREARRLLGANGILAEYQSMRHMANLESVYTYEGTHDIHALIIGQAITEVSAVTCARNRARHHAGCRRPDHRRP